MKASLEVLIPLRNPSDVLLKSAQSLAAQTQGGFSVLISDNFSTTGHEHLEAALNIFEKAGIKARKVRPPFELGRVEHWNWLHYQSSADWLKPLFVGDWLDPDYMATLGAAAESDPRCAYVFCGHQFHSGDDTQTVIPRWGIGAYFPPEALQDIVMRYALQFGPPSVALYRYDAFMKCGGYDPSVPIVADSLLFCKMAARFGAYGVPRACAHFLIHTGRFSHKLPQQQKAIHRETLRYYADLGVMAWHERWRFPILGYLKLIWRGDRRHRRERRAAERGQK